MRHYSDNASSVRVDFFRPSGKWYTTEAINMNSVYGERDLVEAARKCIIKHLDNRLKGMWAVVIDPYHEMSFPLMLKLPE